MKAEQLEQNFKYHPPQENQINKYQDIREQGKQLATMFLAYCPESAERTLAIRKVEEAVMWANASIARNE
jgi:hypothetical protein